jgi:hypothetical protein
VHAAERAGESNRDVHQLRSGLKPARTSSEESRPLPGCEVPPFESDANSYMSSDMHAHNCEAFVRKLRACRMPNGSSRRASPR